MLTIHSISGRCRLESDLGSSLPSRLRRATWVRNILPLPQPGVARLERSAPRVGDLAQVGEDVAELRHPSLAEVCGPLGLHLGDDGAGGFHAAGAAGGDPHEPGPPVRGVGYAFDVTATFKR